MKSKIAMFLMNKKGYLILENFINRYGIDPIDVIIISRDPNVQKDYYLEIRDLCLKNGVRVLDRLEIDNSLFENQIAFAIGWRWIINNVNQLIVFHDSLLPRYRGFAPLVNALINKEIQIGVTALFATTDYDKGDIIAQESLTISYPIKIEDAIAKIADLYILLVNKITCDILEEKAIVGVPQNEKEASYSLWRDEQDYLIDWSMESEYIQRFIDATGFPYKGAATFLNGKKVRIVESIPIQDVLIENRTPGKVIFFENKNPIVVCGKGLLKIQSIIDDETGKELLPLNKFRIRFE
ncbi:methionyl-tRNA formyltransferase [Paenibacillus brevis]|uniref:Methionyl-tRNA formyltransferase n=1 Tax=Paenibacillus brevis TaxID=2841508 RepID=A0ABS6FUC3_9BACL|nr:formyltransferase family protein [Paenibacillus brevis]MBU5673838.1 hypothetical protein [Paenibacillus brevis]